MDPETVNMMETELINPKQGWYVYMYNTYCIVLLGNLYWINSIWKNTNFFNYSTSYEWPKP